MLKVTPIGEHVKHQNAMENLEGFWEAFFGSGPAATRLRRGPARVLTTRIPPRRRPNMINIREIKTPLTPLGSKDPKPLGSIVQFN